MYLLTQQLNASNLCMLDMYYCGLLERAKFIISSTTIACPKKSYLNSALKLEIHTGGLPVFFFAFISFPDLDCEVF
jgi:hypothetical protein